MFEEHGAVYTLMQNYFYLDAVISMQIGLAEICLKIFKS